MARASETHIVYAQHEGISPQAELSALANVYKYILDQAHRNAAGMTSTNGGDAMKGSKNDRARVSTHE